MKENLLVELGMMDYQSAHSFQRECVDWLLEAPDNPGIFVVTQHPPVFTLGKRGGRENIGVSEAFIKEHGVAVVETERGGNITYHGPGQLVIYPVINLKQSRLAVKEYVAALEQVMIDTVADFGVQAGRDPRNHGIWVGDNKIGSVGIRVRRGVAFHGLSLNVNLDFEHHNWISPCGLSGVGVTSIGDECGERVDFDAVKETALQKIEVIFGCSLVACDQSVIKNRLA